MLARLLRWELAIQIGFWALVAAMLVRFAAWSWRGGALLGVSAVLLASIVIIGITFVAASRRGSTPPARFRLGGGAAAVKLFVEEWLAFLLIFYAVQPFERWWMGRDRLRRLAPGERPLLLIHGYRCNRGTWWRMRRALEAAGHCVATLNLEPVFGGVDDYVEPLRARIEEVLAVTGAAQLVVVGHSMGGLAARAYIARHGASRVARLITLGTPHHGSALAQLGWGRNAADMRPGSHWLARMHADGVAQTCPVTAIWSWHDNFVMPQAAQHLDGAENVELAGIGHLRLVLAPEVARLVLDHLAVRSEVHKTPDRPDPL